MRVKYMNLKNAIEGKEYIIQRIETDDEDLNAKRDQLFIYTGRYDRKGPGQNYFCQRDRGKA